MTMDGGSFIMIILIFLLAVLVFPTSTTGLRLRQEIQQRVHSDVGGRTVRATNHYRHHYNHEEWNIMEENNFQRYLDRDIEKRSKIEKEVIYRGSKERDADLHRYFNDHQTTHARKLSLSSSSTLSCSSFVSDEYRALKALYDATSGATSWIWQQNTTQYGIPWNFTTTSQNPCLEHWQYLSCTVGNGSGSNICYIKELIMPSVNLVGSIPNAFGSDTSFPYLITLLIKGSPSLTGTIPISISNITSLEALDLSKNSLTGSIPVSLNRLSSLKSLVLNNNRFTGSLAGDLFLSPYDINTQTFAWPSLETFYAETNFLTGSLPSVAFDVMKATSIPNVIDLFYIQDNMMTGMIPSNITALTHIKGLSLYSNYFSSTIVDIDWSLLTEVLFLYIDSNLLSGTIPDSIYDIPYMYNLELDDNYFTGTISSSVTNYKHCNKFVIASNYFWGSLPASIGDMSSDVLAYFYVFYNMFSGTIPDSTCQWSNMLAFILYDNMFTGSIPQCIGNMNKLQYLYLFDNQLTNTLPDSIGNFTELYYIYIYGNHFTGKIPSTIGNWVTNLAIVDINL